MDEKEARQVARAILLCFLSHGGSTFCSLFVIYIYFAFCCVGRLLLSFGTVITPLVTGQWPPRSPEIGRRVAADLIAKRILSQPASQPAAEAAAATPPYFFSATTDQIGLCCCCQREKKVVSTNRVLDVSPSLHLVVDIPKERKSLAGLIATATATSRLSVATQSGNL